MLFTSPVFTVSTWLEEPDSYNYGMELIREVGPRTLAGKDIFNKVVEE